MSEQDGPGWAEEMRSFIDQSREASRWVELQVKAMPKLPAQSNTGHGVPIHADKRPTLETTKHFVTGPNWPLDEARHKSPGWGCTLSCIHLCYRS
jgi:hypothetical protein